MQSEIIINSSACSFFHLDFFGYAFERNKACANLITQCPNAFEMVPEQILVNAIQSRERNMKVQMQFIVTRDVRCQRNGRIDSWKVYMDVSSSIQNKSKTIQTNCRNEENYLKKIR